MSRFVSEDEDIEIVDVLTKDELEELDRERKARTLGGPGSGNWGHSGRPGEVGGSSSEPTARYVGEVIASVDKRLREFERYEPYISGETPEERTWLQAVKQEAESIQTELQHATSSELADLLERAQRLDKQVRNNPHRARTSHFEWVYAEERALGGPGSGNWGHAGRPGEVGGSAPGEGGLESKPSPVSVEQIAKIHELKAKGVGNAAIAKRMGWHYSEGKRVQRVLDTYNPDGTPKTGVPQPQPQPQPQPEPQPQPQPQPQPEPREVVRAAEISRMKKELEADNVLIALPRKHDEQTLNAVHTSLSATINARADLRLAGLTPPKVTVTFAPLNKSTYAQAGSGVITINTKQPAWHSIERLNATYRMDGMTGFHPKGKGWDILTHEMGHVLHREGVNQVYDTPSSGTGSWSMWLRFKAEKVDIAGLVSRYARENSVEFVAETFTGLVTGQRYPDDVMSAYNALHGPKPATGWKP